EPEDVAEARREIRLSIALAKAVYGRRTELGLAQTDLADRAGLTQAKISRIEGSDTVPTLPLLAKLAKALDATLPVPQATLTLRQLPCQALCHGAEPRHSEGCCCSAQRLKSPHSPKETEPCGPSHQAACDA